MTGYLEVSARGSSASTGEMRLALPLTEPSEDQDNLSATSAIRPGEPSFSMVNHFFHDWVDTETPDLLERCSEWNVVELAWTNIEGAEALEVTWQSYFYVDVEFELVLAIDFRPLD